jgi:tRNA-Thr(GGU) m(6)t(6)A37 methyltransferase TsaA
MNAVEIPERLVEIGRVHAAWRELRDIPLQGGPATIEVDAKYEEALDCIERATHLVVIAYLHKADRSVLKSSPRKLNCSASPCGVFATRSPARPNPLSLTMVELIKCEGLVLHVNPIDLLDGTPVVDLKAYSPGWDSVFAAQSIRRVSSNQLPDTLLIPFLQRDLRNYLGEKALARPAQAALDAVVHAIRFFDIDPRDPRLSIEINGCDGSTDALMAVTGASFSSGRITLRADNGPRRACFQVNGCELNEIIE